MDSVVIQNKLEALRRCVRRVEDKRADSASILREDPDRQDIVALNLTRAIQICVDLAAHIISTTEELAPTSMAESFDGLEHLGLIDSSLKTRLKAAVGFRNVAVHNYQEVNWEIVHEITWHHLEDFRAFAGIISRYIDDEAQ